MPKIEYKYTYLFCPKCQYKFGHRRLGPEKIKCGSCGAVLDTDLPTWDQLSSESQMKLFLSEIILPSWLGVTGCNGVMVGCLTQVFLWALVSMPFIAIIAPFIDSSDDTSPLAIVLIFVMMVIAPLVYPVILALRVRRLIHESREYTRTQESPVWGEKHEKTVEEPEERIGTARYSFGGYTLLLRLVAILIVPVWVLAFYKTFHAFMYSGLQQNDYLVIGGLWLAVIGVGWPVQRELARCLGRMVMPGCLVIPLMPFFLLILAISPHRITATLRELKQMDRESSSSRAKYIDWIDFSKKRGELMKVLEETRDPRSVKPLIKVLKDRDLKYRVVAATTLGDIGDPRALTALINALSDEYSKVRAAAAASLGKLKDLRAKDGLESLLKDEEQDVRDAAKEALEKLESNSEETQ